jgi:hypothetical protein
MHIVGITIWRNYAYRRTIPVKHWIGCDLLWKIKQQKLMLQGTMTSSNKTFFWSYILIIQ